MATHGDPPWTRQQPEDGGQPRPTVMCRWCAEPILAEAIACRFCGHKQQPLITKKTVSRFVKFGMLGALLGFLKAAIDSAQTSSLLGGYEEPPNTLGMMLLGFIIVGTIGAWLEYRSRTRQR